MHFPGAASRWLFKLPAVLACLLFAPGTLAQANIKLGVLVVLEGGFGAVAGRDALRGVEMALKERHYSAGGRKIEFVSAATNGTPDFAVAGARRLIEEDKVDIVIGPLSGSEGIAVKNYAKSQPQVTFVNGSSAAQATTLVEPAQNFFRFTTDGAQWMAGLGRHAHAKGYRRVAVLGEDYAYPYSQVHGFMVEFCRAGGKVVDKHWVPIGTKDFSAVIQKLPQDVDAIFVVLGGKDAANFLTQYELAGGTRPIIGGSNTFDQTVLGYKGRRRDALIGSASAGPIADNWKNDAWQKFVADYKAIFSDALPSPSLFAYAYYVATLATLEAIDLSKGDLSAEQAALRRALGRLHLKTPTGPVHLDENRNAVASNFVTEIAKASDGALFNQVVRVIPNVSQSLGMTKTMFEKQGLGSRTNPECN